MIGGKENVATRLYQLEDKVQVQEQGNRCPVHQEQKRDSEILLLCEPSPASSQYSYLLYQLRRHEPAY